MQKVRPANWTLVTELQRVMAERYGLGESKLDMNHPEVTEREMRFYVYALLSDNTYLGAGELAALEKVSERCGLEAVLKAVKDVRIVERDYSKVKDLEISSEMKIAAFEKMMMGKTEIVRTFINAQNG